MSLDTRIEEATRRLAEGITHHAPATFASSFGAEDMLQLDLIKHLELAVEVFTLDAGRLHEETLDLIARCGERYRRPIRIMAPDAAELESFVGHFGINAFYRDINLRKQCCEIRKMQPLRLTLAGKGVWITGLRRDQSVTHTAVAVLEADAANERMKLNPLADWSENDVREYRPRNCPDADHRARRDAP